jgi:hypothetical protein
MVLVVSWDSEGWKEAGREYHAQNKQAAESVDNLINMTERRNKLREGIRREDFIAYLQCTITSICPHASPGRAVA